ncbi:MAG: hypothetical protein CMP73_05425 [Flavobacteriales bacterium]|nr:hypothetical protein [Flavobacteriales bacterium]
MNVKHKQNLFEKLNSFIKKYYFNKAVEGLIYFTSFFLLISIFFSLIEYFGQLNVQKRTLLFWLYIVSMSISFAKFILYPLLLLLKIGNVISYKEAAKIIGLHFVEVEDKLINILELNEMSEQDNKLISASIDQKIANIKPVPFKKAIDISENLKHIKWVALPSFVIFLFFVSNKEHIITESSARIIKHNTFFAPKAPYNIIFNTPLESIQYNDFLLEINLTGERIPAEMFIEINSTSFKMQKINDKNFKYLLKNITSDINFHVLGGGYKSEEYKLRVLLMPKVVNLSVFIDYPKHTKLIDETIQNNGDLTVPNGSILKWKIDIKDTENMIFCFEKDTVRKKTNSFFEHKKLINNTMQYSIITQNSYELSDTLKYLISVVKDEFPKIKLETQYDSISSQYLFSGNISDDYGLSKLSFNYKITGSSDDSLVSKNITIKKLTDEQFFYQYNFSNLGLNPGDEITYYFSVWDNDAINGNKFTNSDYFKYSELSFNDLIDKIDMGNQKTKAGFNTSLNVTDNIKKDIADLNKNILSKKELDWLDKQKIKDLIEKQKKLIAKVEQTQKQNSKNLKNKLKPSSSLEEKQRKLEELMKKIINEEDKKIIEELEKILNEANKEKLKALLDKLENQSLNIEKELERELELFKQLEFEQNLENIIKKLNEIKEEQKQLITKTKHEDVLKQQLSLQKQMNDVVKDLQNLRKKNAELERKNNMPKTQEIEQDIQNLMQKSVDEINKNNKKKANKTQKNALQKIEELTEKMEGLQMSGDSEKASENMQTLREILENLISLSFDQEELMEIIKKTPKNSPQFVVHVKKQKKIHNDSKIVKDSLFALSKRVVQLEAIINEEISLINKNIKRALTNLEKRDIKKGMADQQFVMTSMNNLALLLSEVLEQMQQDLESLSSNCNKPRNCNKPKNCNKPSMSQIKNSQKELNKKMKNGKKKNGKGAKELMELARKQEEIRKQLLELRDEIGRNGEKGNIDKLLEEMEENEKDIVNDNITNESFKRQEEIITKLLDFDDAKREEEKEKNERKANEWKEQISFDDNDKYLQYIKLKEDYQELYKTKPLQLKPYYKKKVDNYFNIIIKKN